jgi:Common central domain of tyrosinase/Polyphenol oxidase middle domain
MNQSPQTTRPALTRRAVVGGAAGLAGAAALGILTPRSVLGQTAILRQDIFAFAQDSTRLQTFVGAVKEMQDRSTSDPNDPKGWLVNANSHRDFCAIPSMTDPAQIHFCWWFLVWHRAYISVTERKIREISGDTTFSYPYWNWSTDRHIPPAYAAPGSSLSNAVRFTPPRGLDDGEVGFNPDDPVLKTLGVTALNAKIFEAKTARQIARSFGGIARPNPDSTFGNNALEGTPHGPVHVYVGGVDDQGQPGDMTDFATAARDPIFFAHHGNLDRLWENWRRDPARKATEPRSSDFLEHRFVFTWVDGTPLEVAVKDTMDTTNLGYAYDNLDVFRPGMPVVVASAQAASERLPAVASGRIQVPLSPQAAADENERKILEITDVEQPDHPITVGVYLKPAAAPADQPGTNVGAFSAVLNGGTVAWPSKTLSFDITAVAHRFAGQELTVELVPQRIRAQGAAETYKPLKYGQMRIVTEK